MPEYNISVHVISSRILPTYLLKLKLLFLNKFKKTQLIRDRIEASKFNQIFSCLNQFLKLCCYNKADTIDKGVAGYVTCVYFYYSESKQDSKQWHLKGGLAAKKFKVQQSARKLMAISFWKLQEILIKRQKEKILQKHNTQLF